MNASILRGPRYLVLAVLLTSCGATAALPVDKVPEGLGAEQTSSGAGPGFLAAAGSAVIGALNTQTAGGNAGGTAAPLGAAPSPSAAVKPVARASQQAPAKLVASAAPSDSARPTASAPSASSSSSGQYNTDLDKAKAAHYHKIANDDWAAAARLAPHRNALMAALNQQQKALTDLDSQVQLHRKNAAYWDAQANRTSATPSVDATATLTHYSQQLNDAAAIAQNIGASDAAANLQATANDVTQLAGKSASDMTAGIRKDEQSLRNMVSSWQSQRSTVTAQIAPLEATLAQIGENIGRDQQAMQTALAAWNAATKEIDATPLWNIPALWAAGSRSLEANDRMTAIDLDLITQYGLLVAPLEAKVVAEANGVMLDNLIDVGTQQADALEQTAVNIQNAASLANARQQAQQENDLANAAARREDDARKRLQPLQRQLDDVNAHYNQLEDEAAEMDSLARSYDFHAKCDQAPDPAKCLNPPPPPRRLRGPLRTHP